MIQMVFWPFLQESSGPKKVKKLEQIAKLPGGILLAEGGMSKTTLMEQFRDFLQDRSVLLLKLGEYVRDPEGLRTDLEKRGVLPIG